MKRAAMAVQQLHLTHNVWKLENTLFINKNLSVTAAVAFSFHQFQTLNIYPCCQYKPAVHSLGRFSVVNQKVRGSGVQTDCELQLRIRPWSSASSQDSALVISKGFSLKQLLHFHPCWLVVCYCVRINVVIECFKSLFCTHPFSLIPTLSYEIKLNIRSEGTKISTEGYSCKLASFCAYLSTIDVITFKLFKFSL